MGVPKDILGSQFAHLTVVENLGIRINNKGRKLQYWKCRCVCGVEKEYYTSILTKGEIRSCGCKRRRDLVGERFGRLVVSKRIDYLFWECVCVCGVVCIKRGGSLKQGGTQSCGCLAVDIATTHGATGTREYNIYHKMIDRCYNPKTSKYKNYGGRGILVCERWLNDFSNFISDMGVAPTNRHSIDRVDVNGNYEPENCKWSTQKEQCNNRTNNRMIELNGVVLTLSQWCDKLNMPYVLVRSRLDKKWAPERIFTEPKRKIIKNVSST